MFKRLIFILALKILALSSYAQIGGRHSFEFLNVPVDARMAGIGGMNVSLADKDVNLFFQNPAALNSTMNRNFSINYLPYFAGIHTTTLAYAEEFNGNMWGFGLHYMDYGIFDRTDADGTDLGTFSSREYALVASRSHTIDYYTIGVNLKFVGSHLEAFNAFGALVDIGGVFQHPEKDLSIGMTIKNLGFAFKKYTPDTQVLMPFDARIGISYKPEHMPFRFSVTAHHLQRYDIVYLDPNQRGTLDLEGNEIKPRKTFADMLARHFVFGGEFLLSENFNIRVGYNHLRRREFRLPDKSGVSGFSLGFMMRVKSFEIAYGKAFYHVNGGTNNFTITSNLDNFYKRRDRIKSEE